MGTSKVNARHLPLERQEANWLMQWVRANLKKYPQLIDFHAIPNGGARSGFTGAMMKKEGVKKGVPDYFLPFPRDGFHGLYIELKRQLGAPIQVSDEQFEFLHRAKTNGYKAIICRGWVHAKDELEVYLGGGK
jgi:VRR-NUC domain